MKLGASVLLSACVHADDFETGGQWPDKINPTLKTCSFFPFDLQARGLPPSAGVEDDDRILEPDRVIGGKEAVPGSWPWIVGFTENGQRVCAGSVIHDRWILTAEHCFPGHVHKFGADPVITVKDDNSITWTSLFFGDHHKKKKEPSEFVLKAQKFVFLPDRTAKNGLRDTESADIMLIQVESITKKMGTIPNFPTNFIKSACLPSSPIADMAGKRCWIAGWGYTKFGPTQWGGLQGSKLAPVLQEAGINVFSNEYCRDHSHHILADNKEEANGSNYLQTWNEFCAGIPDNDGDGQIDGGIDACSGDSGGPLICDVNGHAVLAGITSRGKGCAMADNPGIYTPVHPFMDWIHDVISNQTDPEDDDGDTDSNGGDNEGEEDNENGDNGEDTGDNDSGEEDEEDEDEDESTDEGECADVPIDLLYLENLMSDATRTVTCKKGNGAPHPNKTKAQNKNRTKKINAFVLTAKKFVGENKTVNKCSEDKEHTLSDFVPCQASAEEMGKSAANYETIRSIMTKVIEDGYGSCKPVNNWIKAVKKKIVAIETWKTKALKGGCTLDS